MERIRAGDSELCGLMAQHSAPPGSTQHHARHERATHLLNALERPRRWLAVRTSASLHPWLAKPVAGIRPDPHRLQLRILDAGLLQILRSVRTAELSTPQRLQLAAALREAGAHTGTVRAWLGLGDGDDGSPDVLDVERPEVPKAAAAPRQFGPLLDLLLPAARAAELRQETARQNALRLHPDNASTSERNAGRERLSQLKAEIFQNAAMVSRRFGYPEDSPVWNYMAKLRDPRVKELSSLGRSNEARRRGLDLQLP